MCFQPAWEEGRPRGPIPCSKRSLQSRRGRESSAPGGRLSRTPVRASGGGDEASAPGRYSRERASGHIIQISSIGGRVGPTGRAAYAAAKFGVEGFSESLSKEVASLGVKVTVIEPGGFRTDFAGSSTELREGRLEYDPTVGAAVRFQRNYNGKQPGDPRKAAAALLHIASLTKPPLPLLLGADAYEAAEKYALDTLASDREWKALSISTDSSP
jgi:NAD(P)-dependent dehydrogenase (short-subunit alcohol dehydrogenase family)